MAGETLLLLNNKDFLVKWIELYNMMPKLYQDSFKIVFALTIVLIIYSYIDMKFNITDKIMLRLFNKVV